MNQENFRNILVIRTDRMGDVILSTPVLTALRRSFPKAKITMMLRPYTEDIVAGHPDVDELLLFENNQTEVELALSDFLDDLVTDYIVINDIKSLSWKTGISEHQIKRKLVDMGVIESVQSFKDKRNLRGIDGARYPQPRYFKLTKSYREEVLFKKVIQS